MNVPGLQSVAWDKFGEFGPDIVRQVAFLQQIGDINDRHIVSINQALRWSPSQYLRMKPESIEQVAANADKFTNIKTIVKVWGVKAWSDFVIMVIGDIATVMNVKNGLNDTILNALPQLLYDDAEAGRLTIPDLMLCFRMGLMGKFGADFSRLDVPTIFKWVNAYYQHRKSISVNATRIYGEVSQDEKTRKNAEAVESAINAIKQAKESDDYSRITARHFDVLVKYCGAELTDAMIKEQCDDEMLQEAVKASVENDASLNPMQIKEALRNIASYNETVYMAKKMLAVEWIKENEL
ncbi:MAG: hypothetical protein KC496_11340 [Anaerolineae bacterium]|nr:hypothetical protein [Anaerolineae bacterium]